MQKINKQKLTRTFLSIEIKKNNKKKDFNRDGRDLRDEKSNGFALIIMLHLFRAFVA